MHTLNSIIPTLSRIIRTLNSIIPTLYRIIPWAALFVPLPTTTIRTAVRSGGAGRARRRHREGGVPRLRRRIVHGRRPLNSLHALPRRLGTAPLAEYPTSTSYPRSVLFQNVRA
jgi:hypothetical protein